MSTRAHPTASLFPIVLASLLAGMAFWLEQASRIQSAGSDGKIRHDPDYMIDNFHLRRFDKTGALQHTLLGKHMRHYPDDDSTMVVEPRLTYHRLPPTFVSAREAQVDGDGEHVELHDDVRVIRGGKSGKPDVVIATQHLHAYPDEEIATTDVPVTITQGLSKTHGSSLKANNKTSIYVLDGPVNGIFFRNGTQLAERQTLSSFPTLPMQLPKSGAQLLNPDRAQSLQKKASSPGPQPKSKPQVKTQAKPPARLTTKPPAKPISKVAR